MSVNNKILLSSPHMGEEELKFVSQAFTENSITSSGSNILGFETDLEHYLGQGSHVTVLNTGTAAIHMALILANVKSTDEVLCQSFTYVASINPVKYIGATPIFVDSEQETWNMCPIKLEEVILDRLCKGKKPKAILIVHSYGMPAKMEEIQVVAKKYDIILIEDAAEALGASYKGQMCGTFGDFGILSFNGNKIITTSGGGALICKNKNLKARALFLATQSKDDAPYYEHSEMGFNYRMSNVSAGIGRGQMKVLEKRIQARVDVNSFYRELFENIDGVTVFKSPHISFKSNYWLSCILVDHSKTGFSKEAIQQQLRVDSIESRFLWKPMHLQPLFSNNQYYDNRVSEKLFKQGLCLPSGSNLTNYDKQRIKDSIYKVLS